jgi:hypothetical protein
MKPCSAKKPMAIEVKEFRRQLRTKLNIDGASAYDVLDYPKLF